MKIDTALESIRKLVIDSFETHGIFPHQASPEIELIISAVKEEMVEYAYMSMRMTEFNQECIEIFENET